MRRILALFGIDARIQRVRAAFEEGALAAEDRAQLLRMAWEDEKHRLKRLAGLLIALVGLTLLAVTLLSAAVIVHFWDTPQRATAAWLVAGFWIVLWVAALASLLSNLRGATNAIEPARRELARDWSYLQARFSRDDGTTSAQRPATRQALLDRIERQRQRLLLEDRLAAAAEAAQAEQPVRRESANEKVVRLAREHPVATGVAAAALVAWVGPRRLLRTTSWLLPILWKLR